MSIKVSQAFERTSANPIDASLALTKSQMTSVNDNLMPAYYFTVCQDDGYFYLYDKTATASPTTGKFTKFEGGGGGTGGSEVFSTTATLDADINDTTTVVAADLPGVSFSDITVGVTLIRDAKGTLGLVTAKNGTTDVTVTTATTSTPTRELTQAQYDNLSTAEKNNGTIYFITDNFPGGTYVGAYETIYSTTEQVVGSYMGKPLYQKIVDFGAIPSGRQTVGYQMNSGLSGVERFFIKNLYTTSGSSIPYERVTIGESDGVSLVYLSYVENGQPIIKISTDTDRSGMGHIFGILQYTKTTDTTSPVEYATPNDYSTSEKIVGSWIDGKPVYQKTFIFDNITLPTNTWTTISEVSATDMDNLFYAQGLQGTVTSSSRRIYGTRDIQATINGGAFKVLSNRANNSDDICGLIIKYTKTTD